VVAVVAKPELLLEIRGHSPQHLARLAWHIGNRHLAAEIRPDAILILPDHVIAEMLRGLGADLSNITAPSSRKAAPIPVTTIPSPLDRP